MSTATAVPSTFDLEGDDARETLRNTGWATLLKNAFIRFRAADGFSHSRALAYQITLTALPGLIAVVGLATILHQRSFSRVLEQTAKGLAPGPAGRVLTQAFEQGTEAGGGGATALAVGLVAALVAGTTAMGQLERGANRIYGVEQDRPSARKYGWGFVLAITAGLLGLIAFLLLVAGPAIADAGAAAAGWSDSLVTIWQIARWPLGIGLVVLSMAMLFKWSPRRHQPSASWLAWGSAISVILWVVFTALLALYLEASKSFGQTYGPLAGIIGLLIWAWLTSMAIFLGLAFAAQLEAVRAGVVEPRTGADENLAEQGADAGVRPGRPRDALLRGP